MIPNPGWPIYKKMLEKLERKIIQYDVPFEKEKNNLTFNNQHMKITNLLIVNFPHNPTGTISDEKILDKIAMFVKLHPDKLIISDETYDRIVFDHFSNVSPIVLKRIRKNVILIKSFSKTYSLPNWRIGYIAANKKVMDEILKVHCLINNYPSFISQEIAYHALKQREIIIPKMQQFYQEKRNFLISELTKINGIKCHVPFGTFYLFLNIYKRRSRDKSVASLLADKKYLYVTDGTIYGSEWTSFIRICFAHKMVDLVELIKRIKIVSDI